MQKVKNTIPVYDICALGGSNRMDRDFIAQPFAAYLQQHPDLHTAHRHTFYHFVLFTSGSGHHTIDFETFKVTPGQVYFMSPGQVHSWSFTGNIDGYIVNFSEALLQRFLLGGGQLDQFTFFRSIAAESVFNLTGDTLTEATGIMSHLVGEAAVDDPFTPQYICNCLMSLFITVQRFVAPPSHKHLPTQNQLVLQNFRNLVNTYYAEMRLPKDYAAMLYITPNHLNALCNDLLQKSAGEVIRDRILLECKRLLINAGTSIADIAFRLNFSDNSHFTKFFKKYTSLTPEEFRRNSLNN